MVKNLKVSNIGIIETGISYGNMNTAKAFYPEGYTPEERAEIFMERRKKVGKDFGFDGEKMYMADQIDKKGTWFEITPEYVEANPKGWTDIREDILIVTDRVPRVAIGHPVADCPVVMAYDKKNNVAAIGHCSAELVDKKMPMLVADALNDSYGTKDEDILAYISMCAGPSWTYDRYPAWAKDEKVWDEYIEEKDNGLYYIDMKSAVIKQLVERKVGEIFLSKVDTITDPGYYSNFAEKHGVEYKKGRNFAGTFFK